MRQKFNLSEIIEFKTDEVWNLGKIISNYNNSYKILSIDNSVQIICVDKIRYRKDLTRCFWENYDDKYWISNLDVPLYQVPKDIQIAFSYINNSKPNYLYL